MLRADCLVALGIESLRALDFLRARLVVTGFCIGVSSH
jgi:hypothetical protein